jgi:multidrug resistance efflux pump
MRTTTAFGLLAIAISSIVAASSTGQPAAKKASRVESVKADLEGSRALLDEAKQTLEAYKLLLKQGAITPAELRHSELSFKARQIEVDLRSLLLDQMEYLDKIEKGKAVDKKDIESARKAVEITEKMLRAAGGR